MDSRISTHSFTSPIAGLSFTVLAYYSTLIILESMHYSPGISRLYKRTLIWFLSSPSLHMYELIWRQLRPTRGSARQTREAKD